jgi:hypothetical protein
MSILQKLTEGIVNRDMKKEGAALLDKWGKTGLLEGLNNEGSKQNLSRLLENQAKELLREASTMGAGGDVEGFAAVAFPIVRRVFGGLLANDLVSVQPMSLPSGLIFFMDFQFTDSRLGSNAQDSLYGGGKVGQEITGGVDLTGENEQKSFYALNNGYTSPTASAWMQHQFVASGTFGEGGISAGAGTPVILTEDEVNKLLQFDPSLTSGTTNYCVAVVSITGTAVPALTQLNRDNLVALTVNGVGLAGQGQFSGSAVGTPGVLNKVQQARRFTAFSGTATGPILSSNGDRFSNKAATDIYVVALSDTLTDNELRTRAMTDPAGSSTANQSKVYSFPINDNFDGIAAAGSTNAIGAVVGADEWGLEADEGIPEIDLKVDSVSVTAMTKKLKAKWSPELGQDLNAYHNLDAEVELTSILSEQIALEIDREILNDLVKGATAGRYYWSRSPGLFLNRDTGSEEGASSAAPDFTGTVSEWYETLLETVNDISAAIHRKTLRGGANFIVTSPEVASILEFTSGFRASVAVDESKGTAGAVKVGQVSKKWDVYIDPYFARNAILVGRKGNSFLESGYVYAPYVPLQVTPTIFGTEDFVPRKGVMTRYAKKMVRPDMYGLVIVRGLLGESGAKS